MSDDLVLTSDKAKRTYRPRKQIHEYAEEVKELTVKLHDAEREIERLKGQRKVGMFERLYHHLKGEHAK